MLPLIVAPYNHRSSFIKDLAQTTLACHHLPTSTSAAAEEEPAAKYLDISRILLLASSSLLLLVLARALFHQPHPHLHPSSMGSQLSQLVSEHEVGEQVASGGPGLIWYEATSLALH